MLDWPYELLQTKGYTLKLFKGSLKFFILLVFYHNCQARLLLLFAQKLQTQLNSEKKEQSWRYNPNAPTTTHPPPNFLKLVEGWFSISFSSQTIWKVFLWLFEWISKWLFKLSFQLNFQMTLQMTFHMTFLMTFDMTFQMTFQISYFLFLILILISMSWTFYSSKNQLSLSLTLKCSETTLSSYCTLRQGCFVWGFSL